MNNFWNILNGISGGNILDVACGSGQFIEVLRDNLKSFDYITGIDVDDESLNEARDNFNSQSIEFIKGSALDLPFSDAHFDTVCISKGLHHLEDVEMSLKEMYRVLKQGGLLIINEMFSDNLTEDQRTNMLYHHLRVDVDNILGISHNYTFEKKEIHKFVGNRL